GGPPSTSGLATRSRPAGDAAPGGEGRSAARGASAVARLRPLPSPHLAALSALRRRGQQNDAPAFHGFDPLASPGVTPRLLHPPVSLFEDAFAYPSVGARFSAPKKAADDNFVNLSGAGGAQPCNLQARGHRRFVGSARPCVGSPEAA